MTTNYETSAWLAEMRAMYCEGDRTPAQRHGLDLINFHGVIVTRETAAEAAADLEAA
jgi:hypothetical protein